MLFFSREQYYRDEFARRPGDAGDGGVGDVVVVRVVQPLGDHFGREREVRTVLIAPLAMSEEKRRPSGRRHARLPRRDSAHRAVLDRGAGSGPEVARRGAGLRDQPHSISVLQVTGLCREKVVARVVAFERRPVADELRDRVGRRPRQKRQRARRADAGRHDDDHHTFVHRLRIAGPNGRQRPVDQHFGANALGHGDIEKVRWSRPRQDHVRNHQWATSALPTSERLQARKRSRCLRSELIFFFSLLDN